MFFFLLEGPYASFQEDDTANGTISDAWPIGKIVIPHLMLPSLISKMVLLFGDVASLPYCLRP